MNLSNNLHLVDTNEDIGKKCPKCGGVMEYDPATDSLKCPYCKYDDSFKLQNTYSKRAMELNFYEAERSANKDWGVETTTILCKACGTESIYDTIQTPTTCPFCGSNQIVNSNESDTIAPGGIVPFRISNYQALELFHKWMKRKWFCPKPVKDKIKEFKGIYLPYWTFDTETFSSYQGKYGIDYRDEDNDGHTTTRTVWHKTFGDYREFINDELVPATKKHDKELLKKLEPFDTEKNKSYKPEYISGYVAERYSLGLDSAWHIATDSIKEKLKEHISDEILSEHHADRVSNVNFGTEYTNVTYKYLLLPVWSSNLIYKGKVYKFMINGQTGKVAGKTPLSIPKIIIAAVAAIAIVSILCYFIL